MRFHDFVCFLFLLLAKLLFADIDPNFPSIKAKIVPSNNLEENNRSDELKHRHSYLRKLDPHSAEVSTKNLQWNAFVEVVMAPDHGGSTGGTGRKTKTLGLFEVHAVVARKSKGHAIRRFVIAVVITFALSLMRWQDHSLLDVARVAAQPFKVGVEAEEKIVRFGLVVVLEWLFFCSHPRHAPSLNWGAPQFIVQ